jgi:G:T-mismatch repair DNA endonuclease (very short patch repair protein)
VSATLILTASGDDASIKSVKTMVLFIHGCASYLHALCNMHYSSQRNVTDQRCFRNE